VRAFACFLGLILLGFASIAAFTYPAWLLLHPHFDFPFHRIGERIGMLALAMGFALGARRLGLADKVSLGYGIARRPFLGEMAIGLALGVATMAAMVAVMSALGLLDWSVAAGFGAAALARILAGALASGIAVALIEETFLRGAMHTGIERESGAGAAVLLTAIVYSATHFFAGYKIAAGQVTAWSGVDLVGGTLHLFAHPFGLADAFLCLFAVGIVLGAVRVLTGNIAACIGLHAGWVWVMLATHALAQPLREAPLGFLISRFDGFTGWLVLALTIPIGVGLRRFYAGRARNASGAIASSR
jgi:hypothetical protein